MTSMLGPYWSVAHRRPQDYAFFKRLNPSVIKVMDGGDVDYAWIKDNLPDALVVARIHALSEQHAEMLSNPNHTGQRHAEEWWNHSQRLGFDRAKTLILGINEPRIWEPGVPEALRLYTIALCDRASQLGLRVGAMQLSVGWPNNDGRDTPPNWSSWHGVEAAIRRNNGALVVHEYFAENGPAENWGWWCGRVLKCPWQVPIVIGEAGLDMGVKSAAFEKQKRGWKAHMTPERYARELAEYVGRMSADSRFVGCAVFAADFADDDWYSFDIEPAYQAILATPIPDTKLHDIHLPAVGTGPQPPTGKPVFMYVKVPNGANIRTSPVASDVLIAVPYGDQVNVTGLHENSTWFRVTYQGITGWTLGELLSLEPPAEPTPVQPAPQPTQPMPAGVLNPQVLEAILQVESGGRAFGQDGKLLIRFEAHIFRPKLGNDNRFWQHFHYNEAKPWTEHTWRADPTGHWQAIHTGKQADEYAALEFAKFLIGPVADPNKWDAAHQSISMGAPQIMGFNHARIGYASAVDMFGAFQRSTNAQLIGFINFLLADPALVAAVKNKDFEGIARGYNGGGNVAQASAKYRAAYQKVVNT